MNSPRSDPPRFLLSSAAARCEFDSSRLSPALTLVVGFESPSSAAKKTREPEKIFCFKLTSN